MQKAALLTLLLFIGAFNLLAQKSITFKVEKLSAPKIKVFATTPYDSILKQLIAIEKAGLWGDSKLSPISTNIVAKSKVNGQLVSRSGHAFF
jgi:hypothetical protein